MYVLQALHAWYEDETAGCHQRQHTGKAAASTSAPPTLTSSGTSCGLPRTPPPGATDQSTKSRQLRERKSLAPAIPGMSLCNAAPADAANVPAAAATTAGCCVDQEQAATRAQGTDTGRCVRVPVHVGVALTPTLPLPCAADVSTKGR